MKRYPDCYMENSACAECSLSNYGKDCRNNPVNNLGYFRAVSNVSVSSLSELSGCPTNYIYDLEKGTRNINKISAVNLYRLAQALGTTMESLLELDEFDNQIE